MQLCTIMMECCSDFIVYSLSESLSFAITIYISAFFLMDVVVVYAAFSAIDSSMEDSIWVQSIIWYEQYLRTMTFKLIRQRALKCSSCSLCSMQALQRIYAGLVLLLVIFLVSTFPFFIVCNQLRPRTNRKELIMGYSISFASSIIIFLIQIKHICRLYNTTSY